MVFLPPSVIEHVFLSIYVHETDFLSHENMRRTPASQIHFTIVQQLTDIFHGAIRCVQHFTPLREQDSATVASNDLGMLFCENCRRFSEQVCLYNGPSVFEVATIIPGIEDSIAGRTDIVLHRRASFSSAGSDVFDKIPVTSRLYDALSYVKLFSFGKDCWYTHPSSLKSGTSSQRIESGMS